MAVATMTAPVIRPTEAIVLEWNVAAVFQGAAAVWDSHLRVSGAKGTDLDLEACPKCSFNDQCIAACPITHVTKQFSAYFGNVWVWTADHDNDESIYDSPDKLLNQISIYCARGLLIESIRPSCFYGGGSEHSIMYNYLLSGAKDIYMGHIQSETSGYQLELIAPQPCNVVANLLGDPDFSTCDGDTACAASWGMIVSGSSSVPTNECQQRILRLTGSKDVVFLNLFTVAISDIAMGIHKTVLSKDDN
ncbi:glycoside hydrolase family 55 protein [Xylariaceae sp. AK1471]|nr:glycoside hydrolase family 55 protein [Xylariaceae sp. AK1471]